MGGGRGARGVSAAAVFNDSFRVFADNSSSETSPVSDEIAGAGGTDRAITSQSVSFKAI